MCLQKAHERDLVLVILRLYQPAFPLAGRYHSLISALTLPILWRFLQVIDFETEPLPTTHLSGYN